MAAEAFVVSQGYAADLERDAGLELVGIPAEADAGSGLQRFSPYFP
jgi:hypothetical protein